MGAFCVPKQAKINTMQVTEEKIQQSQCKYRIFEYLQNYGKQPTMDLIRWIDESYDQNYTSNFLYLKHPSDMKLKKDLSSAFQTLYNGGWTAEFVKFHRISLKNNEELIQYEMKCRGPSSNPTEMTFKVISMFTSEGKFKTSVFKQIS